MFSNIINTSTISSLNGQDFLSTKEQEVYNERKSTKRQQKFLAGRILAKYMLLQNHITNDTGSTKGPILNFKGLTQQDESNLSKFTLNSINTQEINTFPSCLYQKVEILPSKLLTRQQTTSNNAIKQNKKNAYLSILWCKERLPMQISIAHHDDISLVSLSKNHYIGLDIESCEQRVQSFYKNSFTTHEKDWVFQKMQTYDVRKNWLFTLLWTLKEAGLKLLSQYGIQLTLWNMPALEIQLVEENNNMKVLQETNQDGLHYFRCKIYLNIYAKAIPAMACIAFNQNQIISKLSYF